MGAYPLKDNAFCISAYFMLSAIIKKHLQKSFVTRYLPNIHLKLHAIPQKHVWYKRTVKRAAHYYKITVTASVIS